MTLVVRLFGAPRIERDGQPVAFDTRKATALLAYLAVTGGRHRREALAALLWPGADSARGRATLRRTLSVAAAVGPALSMEGQDVWLDPAAVRCDVTEFHALAGAADPSEWTTAAERFQAPFLDGFSLRDSAGFDDWALSCADSLNDELSGLLARLVGHHLAAGELSAAVARAHQRVALDPLSEPGVVDLMRVLAWSGDRPAALRSYRALIRRLDRELGIDPLPQTRELAAAIRTDQLEPPPSAPALRAAPDPPVAAIRRTIVGRAGEQELLTEQWRSVLGKQDPGRVVGLTGDAGMGRTALLEELSRFAQASGGLILSATGRAAERHIGFAAAADLMAPLITDPQLMARLSDGAAAALVALGAAGTPGPSVEGGRRLLLDAARQLLCLAAARSSVLVAVDDAGQVDASSQELLSYLLGRVPRRVLLVMSWPSHQRGSELPIACRSVPGSTMVQLRALAVDDVAELLARSGTDGRLDPDDVARQTGGSPQLIMEYLSAGAVAGSQQHVVDARLASASPLTGQVLAACAVVGVPAEADLLRAVSGRDDTETIDAIEEGVRLGLLVEQGALVDLPHDLARQAVAQSTSQVRWRLLHRRAAEHLQRTPGAAPAVIAEHYAAAGLPAQAATWHLQAADQAAALGANAECLHHLGEVLLHDPPQEGVQARIADALVRLGRYDQALLAYERAAVDSEQDRVAAAELERRIAVAHDRLGDAALALAHVASARRMLRDTDDAQLAAHLAADEAMLHLRAGDSDQAQSLGARALQIAEASGDLGQQARARHVLALLPARIGDHAAALEGLQAAIGVARRADDLGVLMSALNSASRSCLALGRAQEAADCATEALTVAKQRGEAHLIGVLHSALADALYELGERTQSERHQAAAAACLAEVEGQEHRPGIWLLDQW